MTRSFSSVFFHFFMAMNLHSHIVNDGDDDGDDDGEDDDDDGRTERFDYITVV